MFKEERFQFILNRLNLDQKVLLSAMSEELNVSEYTIRRDIKELSDQGLLKMVRGGAVPHAPGPLKLKDRLQYNNENKHIIASKAISMLDDGQVIIFDGGTSALAVAALLPLNLKITVITNSFPIVNILENHEKAEVIFAGGRLIRDSGVTIGLDTIRTFQKIRADVCFLGVCSIHLSLGVTGPHYEETEVKKIMVENSNKVVALSLLEKLDTAEPYFICPADSLNTIITDVPAESQALQPYLSAGINIL